MNKILTKEEAEKIVKSILDPLGFNVCVLDHQDSSDDGFRLCNSSTVKKTIGSLWWKKTVTVTKLEPVFTGWCWEDCIEKLDKWVQTKVQPRVDLAEKYRDKYAKQEADAALHEELSK